MEFSNNLSVNATRSGLPLPRWKEQTPQTEDTTHDAHRIQANPIGDSARPQESAFQTRRKRAGLKLRKPAETGFNPSVCATREEQEEEEQEDR